MQSIWKGSLAFGLVNVPVKLYAATEDHDVRFHQVHAVDGGRVQYKRVCSVCGKQVEYAEIAKAYDAPTGERVVMTADDFDELPVSKDREIDVVEFVPSEQVDPILFDRSYYLEPDGRAVKAYVLLREALERTDRTAIVKFALRSKTRLAALRVRGDVLTLQTMLWPDEVRDADFGVLDGADEVEDRELGMAEAIIDNLSSDFDASEFHDDYREQLLTLIDAKLTGGEDVFAATEAQEGPAEGADGGQVLDLMAALKASVDRTGDGAATGAREKKARSAGGKPEGRSSAASGKAGSTTGSGRAKASGAKRTGAKASAAKPGTTGRKSSAGSGASGGKKKAGARKPAKRSA